VFVLTLMKMLEYSRHLGSYGTRTFHVILKSNNFQTILM